MQSGTKTVYQLTGYKPNGERVRRRFDTKAKAEGAKHLLEIEALNMEAVAPRVTRLTDSELRTCERAMDMLKDGGDLLEAVRHYNQTYVRPEYEMPLYAAVEAFASDESVLTGMRASSRGAVTTQARLLLRRFPDHRVHQITGADIESLTAGCGEITRRTKTAKLSSFFNYCLASGWCPSNPITGRSTPPKRKIRTEGQPAFLTVTQAVNLMRAAVDVADGVLVPYFAMHLFGGIRAEELKRLTWDSINLKSGYIRIEGAAAKTGSARAVRMPPSLVSWLSAYAPSRPPICPPNFRKLHESVRRAAGITEWVRDVGRHTALTYHCADSGLKASTSAWAGNSPQILDKHYRGVATAEEARAYWLITPQAIGGERVVKISDG